MFGLSSQVVQRVTQKLYLGPGNIRRRFRRMKDLAYDMAADELIYTGISCQEHLVAYAMTFSKYPLWTLFLSFRQFRWRTLVYLSVVGVFLLFMPIGVAYLLVGAATNCCMFDEITRAMYFLQYDYSLLFR